jgi:hypothetical protein
MGYSRRQIRLQDMRRGYMSLFKRAKGRRLTVMRHLDLLLPPSPRRRLSIFIHLTHLDSFSLAYSCDLAWFRYPHGLGSSQDDNSFVPHLSGSVTPVRVSQSPSRPRQACNTAERGQPATTTTTILPDQRRAGDNEKKDGTRRLTMCSLLM